MSLTSGIFSISVVSPLEDTCPNAADVNPMQANMCQRKQANNDM